MPPTLALAATVLAALGFQQLSRAPSTGGPEIPTEFPAYTLEIEGGALEMRSGAPAASGPHILAPGFRFEILLRPGRDVSSPVAVHAFVEQGGGTWRPWRAAAEALEIHASGAVVVAGVWGKELSLPSGDHALAFAVGGENTLPPTDEILKLLGEGLESNSDTWRLLRGEVFVHRPEDALDR